MARKQQKKSNSWRAVSKGLGDFSFNVAVLLMAGIVAAIFLEPEGFKPAISIYGIVAGFIVSGIIFTKTGADNDL